ncbi:MAG: hypothetical protein GY903_13025 [Fuerstiella sp.]|nr:hypothetical protein [Fuerstiella sp.]
MTSLPLACGARNAPMRPLCLKKFDCRRDGVVRVVNSRLQREKVGVRHDTVFCEPQNGAGGVDDFWLPRLPRIR